MAIWFGEAPGERESSASANPHPQLSCCARRRRRCGKGRAQSSAPLQAEFERDPIVLAWWRTEIESVSALALCERHGDLDSDDMLIALKRRDALVTSWREISAADAVRRTALRLMRVHPLRAADSLQLAAAIVGAAGGPTRSRSSPSKASRARRDAGGFQSHRSVRYMMM